jgi:hypothetical protein
MTQRWTMFVLGLWIAGSLAMLVVATQNFRTVDRLLSSSANATFSSQVKSIGQPASRELLRYLSSELNRLYFQIWNLAQVVLGLVALWLVWRSSGTARWGVVAMLAVVAVMTLWLQPEITALGRNLDFVPREPPPPEMGRFWVLHGVYTILELVKLLAGIVVSVLVAGGSKPPA